MALTFLPTTAYSANVLTRNGILHSYSPSYVAHLPTGTFLAPPVTLLPRRKTVVARSHGDTASLVPMPEPFIVGHGLSPLPSVGAGLEPLPPVGASLKTQSAKSILHSLEKRTIQL